MSPRAYKNNLVRIVRDFHKRNKARKSSGMGPVSNAIRQQYYGKYRNKDIDAFRLKGRQNATVLETLFGLSKRRAGQVFDNTGIKTGISADEATKLRNMVTNRPLGKMKGAAGLLAGILSAAASAGGTGYIGNALAGNNARYQQALTNL